MTSMSLTVSQFSQSLANDIYESAEQFPVDFEVAWQWLGYSRKDNAKVNFLKCGFVEGIDYQLLKSQELRPQGGFSNREDIYLTAECLKQWAMMSGTEQGKQVRLYFLECERLAKEAATKKLPNDYIQALEALLESEKQKQALKLEAEKQQAVIAALAPVVEVHNILTASTPNTFSVSEAAKMMGFPEFGQKRLFEWLRKNDILLWNNVPYQRYVDEGYFVVKESHSYNGQHVSLQPRLTQKGISWLTKKLLKLGYVSVKQTPVEVA